MLTELIMHFCGWTDVWYAHPGGFSLGKDGRWHVGVWTGPQMDMFCVKECETNEEAEKFLSPGSRTILGATIKALTMKIR